MVCGLTIVNFDLHVHVLSLFVYSKYIKNYHCIAINHPGYAECLQFSLTLTE